MYPNEIFLGLTLYDICLCLAIVACFVTVSALFDRCNMNVKVQRFSVLCGVCAVILGYFSAVLFQAFYNIESLGRFEINMNTGATFYGGLVGGAAVFLAVYFGVGSFIFKGKEHISSFWTLANCAAPSIALAHSIGRIGCLMAGCCHGAVTDAWYGIMMHGDSGYVKYVPVQLFEAIFLAMLFAFMLLRLLSKQGYGLSVYLIGYAVWRFFAEYLRADYRGTTLVDWLTPSQLIAVCLAAVGIALIFPELYARKMARERDCKAEIDAGGDLNDGK